MLISANTVMPVGEVSAVMSRLPISVVNLLRSQPPPQGPSLRVAYSRFAAVVAVVLAVLALLAWRAAGAHRAWSGVAMAMAAVALPTAASAVGLGPSLLRVFAPELAIFLALAVVLLAAPLPLRLMRGRRQ